MKTCSGTATSFAIRLTSLRTAIRPITSASARIVVSCGQHSEARNESSNPTTLMSSGTVRFFSFYALIAVAALTSLQTKTAVGGTGRLRRFSMFSRPA